VAACPEFARARGVAVYAATPDELPLTALVDAALAAGKILLWPRVRARGAIEIAQAEPGELQPDALGMPAPPASAVAHAPSPSDVLVVPGVAFTRSGARLGRGGGYYDRLLASWRGASIGVAFDIQLVDELPMEPHDCGVDLVATPTRLWRRTR